MNLKYQLKMFVQNMTQVKPRSPAVTQRLLEHDLTRLNGLTIINICSDIQLKIAALNFIPNENFLALCLCATHDGDLIFFD